jgi:hypothetical protein
MVSLASQQPVRAVTDCRSDSWQLIKEGRGDHSGVNINPSQVDRDSSGCPVQLGPRWRLRLGPGSLVPAVADDDLHLGMASGVGCNPLKGIDSTCCVSQSEAGHGLPSLDEMHVGIDESRSDEPSSKIDFLVPGRCVSRGLIAANEADRCAVDHNGTYHPWMPRGVHAAPDEDHDVVQEVESG